MRNLERTICLTVVLAVAALVALVSSSTAAGPTHVNIVVKRPQGEISFAPKFLGVCSSKTGPACDDSQFRWRLTGALQPGETLTIDNAPNHLRCFSQQTPLFEVTNNTQDPMTGVQYDSGAPQKACTANEYGTYWPYVVTLTLNDGTKIISDPGGIIFP